MPLVKTILKQAIKEAFNQKNEGTNNVEEVAQKLADAIDAYLKSAEVVGSSSTGPIKGKIT